MKKQLQKYKDNKTKVDVTLVENSDFSSFDGIIIDFDDTSLLLADDDEDEKPAVIYYNAIACIIVC